MRVTFAGRFALLLDLAAEVRKIDEALLRVRKPAHLYYKWSTFWAVPALLAENDPNYYYFLGLRVMPRLRLTLA